MERATSRYTLNICSSNGVASYECVYVSDASEEENIENSIKAIKGITNSTTKMINELKGANNHDNGNKQ